MTLLNLDIDVIITFIIVILRKIKEQFMPRLMWSLSASSLVVRRQLATRPHDHLQHLLHDHLQLYIFFSIAIFGSNHLQHLPHDHLQPYIICNALNTRFLHEKKIILLTYKMSLNLRPIFNSKTIGFFLYPTMFNSFHLSPN